ncbi:MAG: hypothetical protein Q9227_007264 [Pyrenula ochraceoflavens]
MVPPSKRRKTNGESKASCTRATVNSSAAPTTTTTTRRNPQRRKAPKPLPHIESINALSPTAFYSRFCLDLPVLSTTTPPPSTNKTSSSNQLSISPSIFHKQPSSPTSSSPLAPPSSDHAPNQPLITLLRSSSELSPSEFSACFALFEQNSRRAYEASSWGWHPARKKKEMRLPDLKYFLLVESSSSSSSQLDGQCENRDASPDRSRIVAFLSFMPTYESGVPVLYIYELQIQRAYQGLKLGRTLISVTEALAKRIAGLRKMMLTVFRANEGARRFYERCGWRIDEDESPSPIGLRGGRGREIDYEIWCKDLDQAKEMG